MAYKYSFDWSSDIVLSFYEKHTRATDLVAKMAKIETSQLLKAMTLALAEGRELRFRVYKEIIKSHTDQVWRDYKGLTVKERREYLTYVKYGAEDYVLDHEKLHYSS